MEPSPRPSPRRPDAMQEEFKGAEGHWGWGGRSSSTNEELIWFTGNRSSQWSKYKRNGGQTVQKCFPLFMSDKCWAQVLINRKLHASPASQNRKKYLHLYWPPNIFVHLLDQPATPWPHLTLKNNCKVKKWVHF